jgi:hypothetical protein
MSKRQQYVEAVNNLLIDSADSPEDMLELGTVLLKGVASLILQLHEDFRQEAIDGATPTIQFYVDLMKKRYGV